MPRNSFALMPLSPSLPPSVQGLDAAWMHPRLGRTWQASEAAAPQHAAKASQQACLSSPWGLQALPQASHSPIHWRWRWRWSLPPQRSLRPPLPRAPRRPRLLLRTLPAWPQSRGHRCGPCRPRWSSGGLRWRWRWRWQWRWQAQQVPAWRGSTAVIVAPALSTGTGHTRGPLHRTATRHVGVLTTGGPAYNAPTQSLAPASLPS